MMRRLIYIVITVFCLCVIPSVSQAQQTGALGAFSPYTMYGLGDMSVGGTAFTRTMGGVSLGLRRGDVFNYQNPASLSAIPQRSAIFNFGIEGINIYSQTTRASTSHNSVSVHDLGFAIPLTRGVGLGFSLTPLSSVGYSTNMVDNNPVIIENIGRAIYSYSGEGGVSQFSTSLGVQLFRGFSLGATLSYNFGTIDRYYNSTLYPMLENTSYRTISSSSKMFVSELSANFGLQYSVRVGAESAITIGATFSPKINLDAEHTSLTTSSSLITDTIAYSSSKFPIAMPAKYGIGAFFQGSKLGVGVDYFTQDWTGMFEIPADQRVSLRRSDNIRLGLMFTPDRNSLRSPLARWTYKVGARYSTSYLMRNDYVLREYAFTFGVDIPLKNRSLSIINAGFELGQRGAKIGGQVLEQYWKFFVGVSLFGDDGWFRRPKYR